jgi:2-polyprenyl-3-methyl-5-hydroxy-6-metoxy-1,4-benzoquinol methylase
MKKNINQTSYQHIADAWHAFRKQSELNQVIVDLVPLMKVNGSVLDVGCGTGYPITAYLAKQGFQVTGIDFTPKMIEFAQSQPIPNATFLLTDMLTYQPKKTFDAVIAFDSLFHLLLNEQDFVIRKLISLLNPGGIFLMTHGKKQGKINGEMFGSKFTYSSLDTSSYHQLLSQLGMEILTLIEDYKEKSTGTRDLLLIAKKKG